MKKCFYLMSVVVLAMVTVSCNDTSDPFLKTSVQNDYKTNKKNFEKFTDDLLNGCYEIWNRYDRIEGGNWVFHDWDANTIDGGGSNMFLMVDPTTLLQYTTNNSLYPPIRRFTKYAVDYIVETGTICLTEILRDGADGEKYFGRLLGVKPVPVIEGCFAAGMSYLRHENGVLVEPEVRWCFKECDDRTEVLEKYENWRDEQE